MLRSIPYKQGGVSLYLLIYVYISSLRAEYLEWVLSNKAYPI